MKNKRKGPKPGRTYGSLAVGECRTCGATAELYNGRCAACVESGAAESKGA